MALKQASYSSSSDASETRAVQYILRWLRCFDGLRCIWAHVTLSSLAKASRSNWVPVPESRTPSLRRGKLAPIRNAILSINPAMGPAMNHHHNLHHLLRLLLRSLPSKGTCCSIVTEQKRKSRLRLGLAMAMAITAHWHLIRSSLAVRPGVLCMYEMHIPNTQFHSSGTCVPAHAR